MAGAVRTAGESGGEGEVLVTSVDRKVSQEKLRAENSFAGNRDSMVYHCWVQFSLWRFKTEGRGRKCLIATCPTPTLILLIFSVSCSSRAEDKD